MTVDVYLLSFPRWKQHSINSSEMNVCRQFWCPIEEHASTTKRETWHWVRKLKWCKNIQWEMLKRQFVPDKTQMVLPMQKNEIFNILSIIFSPFPVISFFYYNFFTSDLFSPELSIVFLHLFFVHIHGSWDGINLFLSLVIRSRCSLCHHDDYSTPEKWEKKFAFLICVQHLITQHGCLLITTCTPLRFNEPSMWNL